MYRTIIIFTLISYSFAYSIGTVVFLHGTGCAGKTSICSALGAEGSWKVVDEDALYYEQAALRWQEQFPQEFAVISESVACENILHAVMRNQILFKLGVNATKQIEVRNAIKVIQQRLNANDDAIKTANNEWHEQLRMFVVEKIKHQAQYSHVIVDTWLLKPEHIEHIRASCATIDVLAYCPFIDLVKRTIERNNKALLSDQNISSMRFFHQALMSFIGLFELSDSKEGAIDSLSKIEASHALNLAELAMNNNHYSTGSSRSFTRGEFSAEQFEDYKNRLLCKFDKGNELFVVPKIAAHIIRTNQCTCEEAAQAISKIVYS